MLLDTCVLLWLVAGSPRLSDTATALVRSHAGSLHVSSISALEIGLKVARGKLALPLAVDEWFPRALDVHGVHCVPVGWELAAASAALPPHHADPFDRLIVATARARTM